MENVRKIVGFVVLMGVFLAQTAHLDAFSLDFSSKFFEYVGNGRQMIENTVAAANAHVLNIAKERQGFAPYIAGGVLLWVGGICLLTALHGNDTSATVTPTRVAPRRIVRQIGRSLRRDIVLEEDDFSTSIVWEPHPELTKVQNFIISLILGRHIAGQKEPFEKARVLFSALTQEEKDEVYHVRCNIDSELAEDIMRSSRNLRENPTREQITRVQNGALLNEFFDVSMVNAQHTRPCIKLFYDVPIFSVLLSLGVQCSTAMQKLLLEHSISQMAHLLSCCVVNKPLKVLLSAVENKHIDMPFLSYDDRETTFLQELVRIYCDTEQYALAQESLLPLIRLLLQKNAKPNKGLMIDYVDRGLEQKSSSLLTLVAYDALDTQNNEKREHCMELLMVLLDYGADARTTNKGEDSVFDILAARRDVGCDEKFYIELIWKLKYCKSQHQNMVTELALKVSGRMPGALVPGVQAQIVSYLR